MAKPSTPEGMAFKKHLSELSSSIQLPEIIVLGTKLFEKDVVTRSVLDSVSNEHNDRSKRVFDLLMPIYDILSIKPDKFQEVLSVFDEGIYKETVQKINEDYENLKMTQPDSTAGPLAPPPCPVIDKYADYTRNFLKKQPFPVVNEKWIKTPCKKAIQLAALESKENRGKKGSRKLSRFDSVDDYVKEEKLTLFSLDNLLAPNENQERPHFVIVQGAPGIGKSTFAWQFSQQWSDPKHPLSQEYDLLVLLKLRDVGVKYQAKDWEDLFRHSSKDFPQEVAEKVIERDGNRVLFFLEGFDELPCHLYTEGSLVHRVLSGELPSATVIVTTRPWAAQELSGLCNEEYTRKVEIIGFMKNDIINYVEHSFSEATEKEEFLKYFRTNPQLETIMYSPLNSAFVIQIYNHYTQESREDFPHTLTQLYLALVKRLILRCMWGMQEFKNEKCIDLQKLPEPIKTKFDQICIVAFNSFTKANVQISFTDKEMGIVDPPSLDSDKEAMECLGLMQKSPVDGVDSDARATYSFLHFTIQEFLAAIHLSSTSEDQQKCFLEVNESDNKLFVLLSFLMGLNGSIVKHLTPLTPILELRHHQLNWLFESQTPKAVADFFGRMIVYFQNYSALAPVDIYSLTYCMYHSNCTWNLVVDLKDLTTVYSPPAGSPTFDGKIEELSVFNANGNAVKKFFSLPSSLFNATKFLYFFNNGDCTQEDYFREISAVLCSGMFKNLSEFQLTDKAHPNISKVVDALYQNCRKLRIVKMENCIFSGSDIESVCDAITKSKIARLAIVGCSFDSGCLERLIALVPTSQHLRKLDLSHNSLTEDEIGLLSLAIEQSSLVALGLSSCNLLVEGVDMIAESLKKNNTIQFLSLSRNGMTQSGASELTSMLKVNSTLQDLRVNDETMGENGARFLLEAVYNHKTLGNIELPNSCRPPEYGSVIMEDKARVKFV